jgi:hypothetical protein
MVARTARRGARIGDPRLARPIIDYGAGMHAAAEQARPYRWVIPLILVVSVGMALWDSIFGTWGNAIVSVIYLAALLVEMFWWPKRRDELLANCHSAAGAAAHVLS